MLTFVFMNPNPSYFSPNGFINHHQTVGYMSPTTNSLRPISKLNRVTKSL